MKERRLSTAEVGGSSPSLPASSVGVIKTSSNRTSNRDRRHREEAGTKDIRWLKRGPSATPTASSTIGASQLKL